MMLFDQLSIAMLISTILALLTFRSSYYENKQLSTEKYGSGKKLNKYLLIGDIFSVVGYNMIGCYLAWGAFVTQESLKQYADYQFFGSIIFAVLFQQIFPIILEIAMTQVKAIANKFLQKTR